MDLQWRLHDDWFKCYDDLVAYFKDTGDSLVPSKYPNNISLAKWVDVHMLSLL